MGEIRFNSAEMQQIITNYSNELAAIGAYKEVIENDITEIRNNWTDASENLVGREKDLKTIIDNINSIESNIKSMIAFLEDKKTNFEKVNYKF